MLPEKRDLPDSLLMEIIANSNGAIPVEINRGFHIKHRRYFTKNIYRSFSDQIGNSNRNSNTYMRFVIDVFNPSANTVIPWKRALV